MRVEAGSAMSAYKRVAIPIPAVDNPPLPTDKAPFEPQPVLDLEELQQIGEQMKTYDSQGRDTTKTLAQALAALSQSQGFSA